MTDHLSQTFSALADPTRRAMLARLSSGEANVSELAKPFLAEMSLPAVTKHLKVLENAGLVMKGREAQWRPCRLNAEGLKLAADWMEQYRVIWEERFDRLEIYLKTVAAPIPPVSPKTQRSNGKSKIKLKRKPKGKPRATGK